MLLHQECLRSSAICGSDPFLEIVLELRVIQERLEIGTRSYEKCGEKIFGVESDEAER
jgi:hypothetical protein